MSYGGALRVIRSDDEHLKNARDGSGSDIKIKSVDHYEELGHDETAIPSNTIVAKNPGSWANGLRIGILDGRADQIIGLSTSSVITFTAGSGLEDRSGVLVGSASTIGISTNGITEGLIVRCDVNGIISAGTTVTNVGEGVITISSASLSTADLTTTFDFGTEATTTSALSKGTGITQTFTNKVIPGVGTTTLLSGTLKGIITEIGAEQASVKVLSFTDSTTNVETAVDYQEGGIYQFGSSTVDLTLAGNTDPYGTQTPSSVKDWFNEQKLVTHVNTKGGTETEVKIDWNSVADRPTTSTFASSRGGRFDEIHVVVIDGDGKITGNAGTIVEKHLGLSKAKDAEFSSGSPSYWRKYLKDNSGYVFGGSEPSGTEVTGYSSVFRKVTDGSWNKDAQGIIFDAIGASNIKLSNGKDYDGNDTMSKGALAASVDNLSTGYKLLENGDLYAVDFLLMGSSAHTEAESQALAEQLISVAEVRKNTLAFISPCRSASIADTGDDVGTPRSDADSTTKTLNFFSPISSSSYAVFDSGYKYMYDRFNNTFRYVPLNGDIAGLCARSDINNFPWFSPAGTARGAILNAVKLSYNPSKLQRDRLYSSRINPVIFSPGSGIILFGDKTGLAKQSAFDRINVRRLFVYLENAIEAAARDQLFEFNDIITRTNFVNIIEPFLRDVQSKRGIQDYVVICDETNNTAAVIDNNEFVADIYIKPARSINFIGLTFVATRTGVSFEEVVGNV